MPRPKAQNRVNWFPANWYWFYLFWLLVFAFVNLPFHTAPAVAHDFLDSIFGYYVLWGKHPESLFNLNFPLPELSGGMPINTLALSEFSIDAWAYRILPPFSAYVLVAFIQGNAAFFGSLLLLRDYVFSEKGLQIVAPLLLALLFAFLPHKASRVIVAAGVPFLLWALLNLYNGKRTHISFGILIVFPLLSPFHYGGFTICGWLLLFSIYVSFKKNNNRIKIWLGFFTVTILYLLVLYRMFYHWFFREYDYDSIRHTMKTVDWSAIPQPSQIFSWIVSDFVLRPGNHHMVSSLTVYSLVTLFLAAIFCILYLMQDTQKKADIKQPIRLVATTLSLTLMNSLWSVLDHVFHPMQELFGLPLPLHRMDVVSPTFLLLALSFSIKGLLKLSNPSFSRIIIIGTTLLVMVALLLSHVGFRQKMKWALGIPTNLSISASLLQKKEFPTNYLTTIKPENLDGRHRQREITLLSDYFEVEVFKKIKKDLLFLTEEREEPVTALHIGLSPSISWFHGFRSLDGRYYDASTRARDLIHRIFKPEFDKDGIKVIPTVMSHISQTSMENGALFPDLDICAFREAGGNTLFSLWPIGNADDLGLIRQGPYYGTSDPIYVYVVKDKLCD